MPDDAASSSHSTDVEVSFEFFPPADPTSHRALWAAVQRLEPLAPRFVSVTYGANGSARTRTQRIVSKIRRDTRLTGAPHLTCVGASREEVLDIARRYRDQGIRNLVALRGDPPTGALDVTPNAGGFADAVELVAGLMQTADFDISVAAYPETHPQAASPESDIAHLKRKFAAGARRAITQFFFEPECFLRFRDRCARQGITQPIVPGILPVVRLPQLLAFSRRCGASVPAWLVSRLEGLEHDPLTRQLITASIAIDLVQRLRREGVREFHFYTLNRAELTYAICHSLGLRAAA